MHPIRFYTEQLTPSKLFSKPFNKNRAPVYFCTARWNNLIILRAQSHSETCAAAYKRQHLGKALTTSRLILKCYNADIVHALYWVVKNTSQ